MITISKSIKILYFFFSYKLLMIRIEARGEAIFLILTSLKEKELMNIELKLFQMIIHNSIQ